MTPHYLDRLARLVHATHTKDLGESTRAAARAVTLDTIGAMLAGSRLDENARLARLAAGRSGPKTVTLIGHDALAEPMFAALANATAGVSLEVDEGNRWGGGHPAIHVLPATLAVAEEMRTSGAALIEALVAGYEVTSRLGGATRARPNVHSHGTWGTAGAAAAIARLRGADPSAIRAVINLATSMSPANSWAPCFEGATIRNLYPGRAGLQAILAVHLLHCGYSGVDDAPSDLYGTILGEDFDVAAAVDGLDADDRPTVFRIERNYFKFHACCLYNHPALDAVHALVRTEKIAADAVERISVTSLPFVEQMAEPAPPAMLAAKFSVPHAVAAAVVLGTTDVSAFLDDARNDPRVRDLATRVEVRGDPAMSMRESNRPQARVAITLRDGRVLSRETFVVHGDAANPRSPSELISKFTSLAAPTVGDTRATEIVDVVEHLHELRDIRELTSKLGGASAIARSDGSGQRIRSRASTPGS
ncbi:MAG: 2-methylcitrate dehydratase [Candidatus Rokuibacteriota bacterium]|nr:MAG: 2-methylcitrate dehydratase [Candidatus Rokubacteria bacterium]